MVFYHLFDFNKQFQYKTRQSARMQQQSIVLESGVDYLDKEKRKKMKIRKSQTS